MNRVIDDFKSRISSYDKDYKFSQEEVLNILERYEIKYKIKNEQTTDPVYTTGIYDDYDKPERFSTTDVDEIQF